MRRTNITTWKVALLLYGSGTCALVYQMAWLRDFRLIFGASTAASAAVLATFMAGLGLGSLLLGHRADRTTRPLRFYGNLELIIAVSAALTPLLIYAVRQAYIATGGSPVMGITGATVVRLVLSSLVLLVPTFLMGGTLPAAARSVESQADVGRRNLALLYGANTLGAVTGSALATFFLVEMFGTHKTLWAACLVNVLIALTARALSASSEQEGAAEDAAPAATEARAAVAAADDSAGAEEAAAVAPPGFVLVASALVGFAFLLMELVWYRMLGPILGGSTFTFGLILVVALLGIGLGGAAYAIFRANRPATLTGFAVTCALEALFIAIPFALGDGLAVLAMQLRALASLGFFGLVMGWTIITLIVVLPAAFIAGIQFPLLIALLGRGRAAVGRHVGLAYAWNTVGAIVGSLAGGFGLLPLLSSVHTWRMVVIVLAALAGVTLALAAARELRAGGGAPAPDLDTGRGPRRPRWARMAGPAVAALVALLLILSTGPTAGWRHSGIGAGRADHLAVSHNFLRDFLHDSRRNTLIEWEGVESSVAINNKTGFAFIVNGKSDGHMRNDAGTQIMSGLIGALVHPRARTCMIIGLGTGTTAGWLGAIPWMEKVDVVELEPAILEVARMCTPGNHDVMNNPKVSTTIGDAREALLTSPERYDLIFSEPSNPYRAGIASMYTHEWYDACAKRLNPGGIFLQWCQGYEVDGQTIRTIYATLNSVFPHVETWRTHADDMLLMCSMEPITYDVGIMRARMTEEPFRTAIGRVWRAPDLEGVFSRHLAAAPFAQSVARAEQGRVNTDDHNFVEFSFARTVGRRGLFSPQQLLDLARQRDEKRPAITNGAVDWERVEDRRASSYFMEGAAPTVPPVAPNEPQALRERRFRLASMAQLLRGNVPASLEAWKRQPRAPEDTTELMFVVSALNEVGNDEAAPLIEAARAVQPIEADAMLAHLRWRQRRGPEAFDAMEAALLAYRRDPWPHTDLMTRTIALAEQMSLADQSSNRQYAVRMYNALSSQFCLDLLNDARRKALVKIAAHIDAATGGRLTVGACEKLEPNVPWNLEYLVTRVNAYAKANHPLTMQAARDVDAYRAREPFPFEMDLAAEPLPTTLPAFAAPATGPGPRQ